MPEDIEQGPYEATADEPSVRLCNFATGKSDLLSAHKLWVERTLAPLVKADSQLHVQIAGLASRLGSEKANAKLALQRAEAVAAYLEKQLGRSHAFLDVGSYSESLSGGNKSDNDGLYRAAFVSVSAYGFTPPTPATQGIGELRKWDDELWSKMKDEATGKMWLGVGVKAGGTCVFVGVEGMTGLLYNLNTRQGLYSISSAAFRLGPGLGASGNPVAVIMMNTTNPTYFDGQNSSDWGVNVAFGANWSKYAKMLAAAGCWERLIKIAKYSWASATAKDWQTLRDAMHSWYVAADMATGAEPQMICLDIPVGSVGYELSVFKSWGTVSISQAF